MTLDELKTELEKRTEFRFEKILDYFYGEALTLKGIEKKTQIRIHFFNVTSTNKRRIGIGGDDKRKGYSGFGIPCDKLSEVVEWLNKRAPNYGWKPSNEQISF